MSHLLGQTETASGNGYACIRVAFVSCFRQVPGVRAEFVRVSTPMTRATYSVNLLRFHDLQPGDVYRLRGGEWFRFTDGTAERLVYTNVPEFELVEVQIPDK